MKKLCSVLLALSLFLPLSAHAAKAPLFGGIDIKGTFPTADETADDPAAEQPLSAEDAMGLLNEAIVSDDFAAQSELILDAARRVAKDDPGRAGVLITCSRLLFYLDAESVYDVECEAMLRDALDMATGDQKTLALQMLAEQLNYAGRADEAVELIGAYLTEQPNDAQLTIVLASALYYADRLDEALETLDVLLEDSPENITAALLRAEILTGAYRFEEALTAYQQIADQHPDRLEGLYGLYITYEASGQFERAARAIDALIQQGGDYELWLKRAQLRLWRQYDPALALEEAEALLRSEPDWLDVYVVKLGAYLHLHQYDDARKTADAIAAFDEGYADLMRGIIAMNEKRWSEAEVLFATSLEKSPALYTVWQNVADTRLDGFNDPEGALLALAHGFAATEGVGTPTLFWELGRAYHRQGRLLEAARAFAAGDALTYDDTSLLYSLVVTCMDAGRKQDMLDMLAEMEKCYPGWHDTMLARVVVEDMLGNADAALEAFEALGEKFPHMAKELVDWEGALRATVGDRKGAEMIQAWIAEKDDAGADNWAYYAYALMKLGDGQAARDAMATAESLLEWENPERAFDVASTGMFLALTRAELLMNEGDPDGCVSALDEAGKLGWQPVSLVLQPQFAQVYGSDAFQALLARYPSYEGVWDLMPMPEIPEEP